MCSYGKWSIHNPFGNYMEKPFLCDILANQSGLLISCISTCAYLLCSTFLMEHSPQQIGIKVTIWIQKGFMAIYLSQKNALFCKTATDLRRSALEVSHKIPALKCEQSSCCAKTVNVSLEAATLPISSVTCPSVLVGGLGAVSCHK